MTLYDLNQSTATCYNLKNGGTYADVQNSMNQNNSKAVCCRIKFYSMSLLNNAGFELSCNTNTNGQSSVNCVSPSDYPSAIGVSSTTNYLWFCK